MTSINFVSHWFDSAGVRNPGLSHGNPVFYRFGHRVRSHDSLSNSQVFTLAISALELLSYPSSTYHSSLYVDTEEVGCWRFYVLATSKVISGWVLTCALMATV